MGQARNSPKGAHQCREITDSLITSGAEMGATKEKVKGEKQMAYTAQLVLRNEETENQGTRAKYGEEYWISLMYRRHDRFQTK